MFSKTNPGFLRVISKFSENTPATLSACPTFEKQLEVIEISERKRITALPGIRAYCSSCSSNKENQWDSNFAALWLYVETLQVIKRILVEIPNNLPFQIIFWNDSTT